MISIRKANIDEFVNFPYDLYYSCKNWVGGLKRDVKRLLSSSHPFWKRAEGVFFVAEKDGKIKGRIAGILNYAHNEFWNENVCFFGFFDCVDDELIARKLFESVEDFAKKKGCSIVRGPANPSSNYTWGLLVENFNDPNCIMMPYNYPYYEKLLIACGYKKEKDLYAFEWNLSSKINISENLINDIKEKNKDITIENADLGDFGKIFQDVKNVYNKAWEKNWGFIPMSDEEIKEMAKELKPLLKSDYLIFARNENGKAIAFSLMLPDFNIPLACLNHGITFFGILKAIYKYFFGIDRGRVLTLGVNEEYRGRGIEVLIILKAIEIAKKYKWKRGELSWTLEDNIKINKTIEKFGASIYKRYRIFSKFVS